VCGLFSRVLGAISQGLIARSPSSFGSSILLGLLLSGFLGGATLTTQAQEIQQVQVRTQRGTPIDPQSVLAFLQVKPGGTLSREAVALDVRELEKTRRYTNVRVNIEKATGGVNVIYLVTPKPFLRTLTIRGNKAVSDRKFRSTLELQQGDLIDQANLTLKLQEVRETYRKRYYPNADIRHKLIPQGDGGVVDVLIEVDEKAKVKVDDIRFTGNKALSDWAIRRAMTQKRASIISFITKSGTLDVSDLEADKSRIKSLYRTEGYQEIEVGDPVFKKVNATKTEIVIPITEGPRYKIGEVRIEGAKLYGVEQLRRQTGIKPGDVASSTRINEGRSRIRDYYSARGFFQTGVIAQKLARADSPVLDIVYKLQEGELSYVRNVEVTGNDYTKDKVILRELNVLPGDVLNETAISNSESKLRNTGLFGFAAASVQPTEKPDHYDVVFDVQEGKTGNLGAAVGFSSIEEGFVQLEISQGNFDAFNPPTFKGGGQKAQLRGTIGNKTTNISGQWIEPWFLDRRLQLSLSGFHNEYRYFSDDYEQRNTGVRVGLSKPLATDWRVFTDYELERINVHDISTNASETIQIEGGVQWQSGVTAGVIRDTRDRPRWTTKGGRTTLSAMTSGGPLGADVQIYEFMAKHDQYVSMWFDHVFKVRTWTHVIQEWGDGDRVPLFDRRFLGGPRTVRGFDYREVGPKDENGEPIGGNTDWYLTAEYDIPIVEKVHFATFYDMGFVARDSYDWKTEDINNSWGIGLRLDVPGFPLQLDYSWPIDADEFNDRSNGRFSFLIGQSF